MSGRRAISLPPHAIDMKPERGKCIEAICFSWKFITCIVSHVTLVLIVVSYCVGGAYLFQYLEKSHEIEVKMDIQNMRKNLTNRIWRFSDNATYLSESDWITAVRRDLTSFEKQILTAMKADGWDGDEDILKTQWTFVGSLFYSIIVITTIGYGHISPRTDWGKVTTIFYAILGIPLMLLCLSNIGDIMATSFRLIYWRICCYICTRSSEHRRRRRTGQRFRSSRRSFSSCPPYNYPRNNQQNVRMFNDPYGDRSFRGEENYYSGPELYTGQGGSKYEYNSYNRKNLSTKSARNKPTLQREDVRTYRDGGGGGGINRRSSHRLSSRPKSIHGHPEYNTVKQDHRGKSRSKQYINSSENYDAAIPTVPLMGKRSSSRRSMRASHVGCRENARETRELCKLNPQQMRSVMRGRSVPHNMEFHSSAKPEYQNASPISSEELEEDNVLKSPIILNRYALDEFNQKERMQKEIHLRSRSMPSSVHQHRSRRNPQRDYQNDHSSSFRRPRQHHHHQSHDQNRQFEQRKNNNFNRPRSYAGNHLELPKFISPSGMNNKRRSHSRLNLECPDEYNMKQIIREHSPFPDKYDHSYDDRYIDDGDIEAGYNSTRYEMGHREKRKQCRERSEKLPPSPRIMSPMGFAVKRQVRRRQMNFDDDDSMEEEFLDYFGDISPKNRPVPIWLCVFLVIAYILGGAALFSHWEHWSLLDSAYFCFVTLTTIGFGDFVPAKGVQDESEQSIAYCSLYLLFGISLLAMSFNLVQEEFIANVKEVARRLGILKDDEEDEV